MIDDRTPPRPHLRTIPGPETIEKVQGLVSKEFLARIKEISQDVIRRGLSPDAVADSHRYQLAHEFLVNYGFHVPTDADDYSDADTDDDTDCIACDKPGTRLQASGAYWLCDDCEEQARAELGEAPIKRLFAGFDESGDGTLRGPDLDATTTTASPADRDGDGYADSDDEEIRTATTDPYSPEAVRAALLRAGLEDPLTDEEAARIGEAVRRIHYTPTTATTPIADPDADGDGYADGAGNDCDGGPEALPEFYSMVWPDDDTDDDDGQDCDDGDVDSYADGDGYADTDTDAARAATTDTDADTDCDDNDCDGRTP